MFSQKLILNKAGDTTICFSLPQGKYLLKQTHKVLELDTLLKLCEAQLFYCSTIVTQQEKNAIDYKLIINNNKDLVWIKDNQIAGLELELNNEKKALKKQKFYKWVSIIGGASLSCFVGIKYLTK